MGWVSWPLYIFVFLASFFYIWWPNIWLKMRFPELFEKYIGSISFIPDIYPYGMSFLTSMHFRVPSLIFGPLVAKYLAEIGLPELFAKLLAQFIPYLTFILMGWISWPLYIFVFLASFSALWWPNVWLKMRFPELFKKLLAQFLSYLSFTLMGWVSWPLCIFKFLASFSALWWPNIWLKMGFPGLFAKLLAQFISYLAFILMGWVSWPLYIFVFLASFSALWWPNIWLKMGFPEFFEKTIGSIHYIPGIYPYVASLLTPMHFRVPSLFIGYFWMRWVVIRAGVYCPHLWAQLVDFDYINQGCCIALFTQCQRNNSMWPSDIIWWHRSGSILPVAYWWHHVITWASGD